MKHRIVRYRCLVALFSLFSCLPALAALNFNDYPRVAGFERIDIRSEKGLRLDILARHDNHTRPVLVLIPGSTCISVLNAIDNASQASIRATVPLPSVDEMKTLGVHVAVLERRNLISMERLLSENEFEQRLHPRVAACTSTHGGISLEERVSDVRAQIATLRKQAWAGPILLVGTSEGGDVAAGVLAQDNGAAQAVLMIGGAGPTQFFDFIHQSRSARDRAGVAAVFAKLDDLLSGRESGEYMGHSPDRWRSFAVRNTPLDSLLQSHTPLFIAHGELDNAVPIASADLVVAELMRQQPDRAIYYWSMPEADHGLKTAQRRRIGDAYTAFVSWWKDGPKGRTFRSD